MPDLETVQHPILGPLKFPVGMGPDERNESIQRALIASGKAAPPAAGPHVDMQPSMLGSAESMGPQAVTKGKEAATKAYGGVSIGRAVYSPNADEPQPVYPKPTPAQDSSNGALVGAAITAPFTGGESLLTRLGLMGAGAGAGSGGMQLLDRGKVEPEQTAGDITNYGVIPELAGSAVGGAVRNAGKIGRSALAGGTAAAGRIPFVGPPVRAGLRAAYREWNELAPTYRDMTRANVPYAGEDIEPVRVGQPQLRGDVAPAVKPSGRLVLSPEEAQAEIQQMQLAKRMASQRGMQYAAGQKPMNPGTR